MQIFNELGGVSYSTDSVTWNQVDMVFVKGGGAFSKDYPILKGRETLVTQMMINPPPIDRKAIAHTISVVGTLVTINGGSEDSYGLILMR